MAIPEQTGVYTVNEFEAFIARPENADRLFELIHGEIIEKVPTQKHGLLTGNLFGFLWNHSRQRGVGFVVMEVRHRVPGDQHNDRIPDISYYADADRPLVERGPVPYLPDLAVEVKSPDDTYNKMREKADYYLANGVRLVWLVYPEKRLVVVRSPDSEDIFTENDILDGGDVLPDFKVPVRDIFMKGNQLIQMGVYELVDLIAQLRGEAGANQVADAAIGMMQNIGGTGATVVTHILATY